MTPTQAAEHLIEQGLTASRAGVTEEAMALFRQAATAAPQSGIPHFLLAAELAQLGRMEEAEAAYAAAVLLAPELHMARYQLGLVQFTSNRPTMALLTWEPLLRLPEENPLPKVVMGFASLAQDDFASAEARFQEAIALNHDNEALNKDMRMMLERIEALMRTQAAQPAEARPSETTQAGAEDKAGEESSLHVLLSNYQQQGPLH